MKESQTQHSPEASSHEKGQSVDLWQPLNEENIGQIDSERAADLLDKGSLTERLIQASKGDFKVEVMFQDWGLPDPGERQRLGLKEDELALIREVKLICHSQIWVLARSIIPKSVLEGETENLGSLGNKPLGQELFKDPNLKRTLFEFSPLNVSDFSHLTTVELTSIKEASGSIKSIWARRSVFRLKNKELLVTEAFLPACPKLT